MENKRNIIICDCDMNEIASFKSGIESSSYREFDVLFCDKNIVRNHHRSGIISNIIRYINYFSGGFFLFLNKRKFRYIVSWQQFYGLAFSFFCNLFHVRKTGQLIICNYTYKEKIVFKKLYYYFMKKSLERNTIDFIHVSSKKHAKLVCEKLGYEMNKIIIHTFGVDDNYKKYACLETPDGYIKDGFFLSIGRSNRDYDFLLKVWEKISYPLVIICDTYNKKSKNPFVEIKNNINGKEQYTWINNCKANIIIAKDNDVASGDTVLLTSMSLGKLVIVSSQSTLDEMYIKNNINGVAVNKNILCFRETVMKIIEGKYMISPTRIRNSFLKNFTRKALGNEVGKYINQDVQG